MTVFIITAEDYGDFFVEAVYAVKADAERAMEVLIAHQQKRRRGRASMYEYKLAEHDVK